jgi:hypothetical protein
MDPCSVVSWGILMLLLTVSQEREYRVYHIYDTTITSISFSAWGVLLPGAVVLQSVGG